MSYGIHGVSGTDSKTESKTKDEARMSYERDREHLLGMLEDLLWDDLDAMFQLYDYSLNRRNHPDKRVTEHLKGKGLLNLDGTLPDATNEAMYEMRTGYRPFWLRDKDAAESKIIDITDYLHDETGGV